MQDMEAILKEAFGPDVTVRDFYMTQFPKIHAANLERFGQWTDQTLIVSAYLRDTDERYTLAFSPDGVEVEDEEMVDFPLITLAGNSANWSELKTFLGRLSVLMDQHADKLESQYKAQITPELMQKFERYEGTITIGVDGVEGVDGTLEFDVVLNDYEKVDGAPDFKVVVGAPQLEALLKGEVDPTSLKDAVKISGQMTLGLSLLAFFNANFNG